MVIEGAYNAKHQLSWIVMSMLVDMSIFCYSEKMNR